MKISQRTNLILAPIAAAPRTQFFIGAEYSEKREQFDLRATRGSLLQQKN
jgi:hypothetical protein